MWLLAPLVLIGGCQFPDFDIDARGCPCAPGWTCDERTQFCVLDEKFGAEAPGRGDDAQTRGDAATDPGVLGSMRDTMDAALADAGSGGPAVVDASTADAGGNTPALDASVTDSGMHDAGGNGNSTDASVQDSGEEDSGGQPPSDAGPPDTGTPEPDAGGGEPCDRTMHGGDRKHVGEFLCSSNGRYRFGLDLSGDLVLLSGETVLWSGNTCCGQNRLAMQRDGNLVVYDEAHDAVFSSRTAGEDGAYLAVENDGRAVLWRGSRVVWSTDD